MAFSRVIMCESTKNKPTCTKRQCSPCEILNAFPEPCQESFTESRIVFESAHVKIRKEGGGDFRRLLLVRGGKPERFLFSSTNLLPFGGFSQKEELDKSRVFTADDPLTTTTAPACSFLYMTSFLWVHIWLQYIDMLQCRLAFQQIWNELNPSWLQEQCRSTRFH